MRLAVFTNQFPSRVTTFFARDMRSLLEAGVEVDIFAIYPHEPDLWRFVPDILGEHILPKNRTHHTDFNRGVLSIRPWPLGKFGTFLADISAIGVSAVGFGIGPLAKSLYVAPKAWVWAQEFAGRYDHVMAYWGNYAATCAYLFHRLAGKSIPFSIYLHAGTDLYRDQVFLKHKLFYSDCIITECEFNRKYIRQLYPEAFDQFSAKIQVNYMGLDFSEFPYGQENRLAHRVLGVGRLSRNKGYDYLVKATSILVHKGINIELELIGSGEEEDALRTLAQELQIHDKVHFKGWLTFDDVRSAMMKATVFAHPSSGIGDAKPNVIEEAMALGVPVVASNVAGIPELLNDGKCGMLVPSKDPIALADAIEKLLQSESLRRSYAEAARRFAEQSFDLWRNGKRLADALCSAQRTSK